MIPIKIQCGCGQRYAFDIVPFQGRMPSPVACPTCGADGTAAANEIIAQTLASQPVAAPMMGVRLDGPTSPPPAPLKSGVRLAAPAAAPADSAPPPIPQRVPPPVPMRPSAPRAAIPLKPKPVRGNDGWAKPETGLNKLGSYVVMLPGMFSAMISAHVFGIDAPTMILCIIVGVAGALGGALNIAGRGPILAGILVGITMAFGGYGAAYWWINGRNHVYVFEATIAFVIGAIPGFALQYALQQILKKRAGTGQ